MRAPILGSLVLAFAGVIASACNSAGPPTFETTSFTASSIQNGQVDQSHPYAVGVCIGNGAGNCSELCSGTLITPNIVLTARHCIDAVPDPNAVNCQTDQFGAQNAPQFWVTTYFQLLQSSQGWHKVKSITLPNNNFICGNDIAILELSANVPGGEATPVEPVGQYSMTDHTRYKTTQTAIGYGKTSAGVNDAGTRHILQNIKVVCIPGDLKLDCPMGQVDSNEYIAGDGTCQGDSGSGAFEQSNFNANTPVTMGILSRGGVSGNNCVGAVYTRTDAWRALILQAVKQGSLDGGYPMPPWTQPAPPQMDASMPKVDSSVPSDGSMPNKTPLGGSCNGPSDCASNDCESFDNGQTFTCTQACDPTNACPTKSFCDRGFCRAGSAPDAGAATSSTRTTEGCTTGEGNSGNVGAIVIAAFAVMVGARRRKKSA